MADEFRKYALYGVLLVLAFAAFNVYSKGALYAIVLPSGTQYTLGDTVPVKFQITNSDWSKMGVTSTNSLLMCPVVTSGLKQDIVVYQEMASGVNKVYGYGGSTTSTVACQSAGTGSNLGCTYVWGVGGSAADSMSSACKSTGSYTGFGFNFKPTQVGEYTIRYGFYKTGAIPYFEYTAKFNVNSPQSVGVTPTQLPYVTPVPTINLPTPTPSASVCENGADDSKSCSDGSKIPIKYCVGGQWVYYTYRACSAPSVTPQVTAAPTVPGATATPASTARPSPTFAPIPGCKLEEVSGIGCAATTAIYAKCVAGDEGNYWVQETVEKGCTSDASGSLVKEETKKAVADKNGTNNDMLIIALVVAVAVIGGAMFLGKKRK